MRIIIGSIRKDGLADFVEGLRANGASVEFVAAESALKEAISREVPRLVILDEAFAGKSTAENVVGILQLNAFIHTALLSPQSAESLHDALEGLGMAAILPERPGAKDAGQLIATVKRLG